MSPVPRISLDSREHHSEVSEKPTFFPYFFLDKLSVAEVKCFERSRRVAFGYGRLGSSISFLVRCLQPEKVNKKRVQVQGGSLSQRRLLARVRVCSLLQGAEQWKSEREREIYIYEQRHL